eukprot:653074-Pleurochrysis_carterae.AAC.3
MACASISCERARAINRLCWMGRAARAAWAERCAQPVAGAPASSTSALRASSRRCRAGSDVAAASTSPPLRPVPTCRARGDELVDLQVAADEAGAVREPRLVLLGGAARALVAARLALGGGRVRVDVRQVALALLWADVLQLAGGRQHGDGVDVEG